MSFTSTLYRGHDLLTLRPNEAEDRDVRAVIAVDEFDTGTGEGTQSRRWASPVLDRPFAWVLDSRDEISDFLWWVAERRGRYAPCWVPTWHRDLDVVAPIASDATAVEIASCGFVDRYLPLESRRHLALITPQRTVIPRRVTDAVDNEDGTETLTIESAPGVALSAGCLLSFLVLARLSADDVELDWEHGSLVTSTVRLTELPRQMEEAVP